MLGRPSNNLQIGIVGMPNVGKSSLFNIMSRCGASSRSSFYWASLDEYGELTLHEDRRRTDLGKVANFP